MDTLINIISGNFSSLFNFNLAASPFHKYYFICEYYREILEIVCSVAFDIHACLMFMYSQYSAYKQSNG